MTRIYGITGWKNAGKTSLMERLIAAISARGLRVSSVKHAHHGTDVDQPGRDSYRHRAAGAGQVILASPARWALMTELRGAAEPALDDLIAQFDPCDLVLVEGFKSGPHPKLEAHRAAAGHAPLALKNATVRAVASDAVPRVRVPLFHLDDTTAIAAFILREVGL